MDNYFSDDIDKVFRERFEGLKDHSVDPGAQWLSFESSIPAQAVAGSASGGSMFGATFWSMAASFTGLVAVATMATMDTNVSQDIFKQAELASVGVDNVTEEAQKASATTPRAEWPGMASLQTDGLFIQKTVDIPEEHIAPSMEAVVDITDMEMPGYRDVEELALMDRLIQTSNPMGVIDREAPSSPNFSAAQKGNTEFYTRLGIRLGNGESNTENNPSLWRVNSIVGLGLSHDISPITFLTFELNYLQRSGNGVERSKNVDYEPLLAVLSNYGVDADQRVSDELKNVRESLVATKMDYLHMPIQIHVKITDVSAASIGFYADYLLRVSNESYMVYNETDYIGTNFGWNDKRNRDGLKYARFGLMGGFQQSVTSRLAADVRAMIPITSLYDRKCEYSVHEEPNQLVDFQFSLSYRI